jgi:S1-C subfamily serine protease
MMSITADYARGSSGSPVLDDSGAVVGMVADTRSIYYTIDHGAQQNLQMVVKECVPSASILKLFR